MRLYMYPFLRLWFTGAGSPGSDLKLAKRLQTEEEQRRRQEEGQQEREEFKKLQVWILHCTTTAGQTIVYM